MCVHPMSSKLIVNDLLVQWVFSSSSIRLRSEGTFSFFEKGWNCSVKCGGCWIDEISLLFLCLVKRIVRLPSLKIICYLKWWFIFEASFWTKISCFKTSLSVIFLNENVAAVNVIKIISFFIVGTLCVVGG